MNEADAKRVHRSSFIVPYQLIERHQAFAAANQLRCNNRSAGESFASARAMRDLDQVIRRVEEERVQSELAADARCSDWRIELASASALDFIRDADRGAARSIFLLRVVPLFHACRVLP